MTLRLRTLLLIGIIFAVLLGMVCIPLRVSLLPRFEQNERDNAQQVVYRALDSLAAELDGLHTNTSDWARWDDTYAFVQHKKPDFVAANLTAESFSTLQIHLMVFTDTSGRILWSGSYDPPSKKKMPVPPSLRQHLTPHRLLLQHPDIYSNHKGLLVLPEGIELISSWPILTGDVTGPSRGTLIWGRSLNETIRRLQSSLKLLLSVHRLDNPQLPPDLQQARAVLSESQPVAVQPLSEGSMAGYALLKDIYGQPALILRVEQPRTIYQQGRAFVNSLILPLLLVVLICGGGVCGLMEKMVLSRLVHLSRQISRIGAAQELSGRVSVSGQDELAKLAETINQMLESLERAERERQRVEVRYRRLVEQIPVMTYIAALDEVSSTVYVSPQVQSMLGFTETEWQVNLAMWSQQLHSEDRERVLAERGRSRAQGEPFRSEYRLLNRSGDTVWVLDEAVLLRDDGGQPFAFQGVIMDITKLKQVQEELARSNQELQQFAYISSHDLREPLRAVVGYLQLLKKRYGDQLDEEAHRFIDRAMAATFRMDTLTNDLLAYSRVSTHWQPPQPVDCEHLLEQTLANLQVAIEENQAEVTHDPLPTVMADPSQLGQVFQNLIGNALKFRREEPPRVHIAAQRNGTHWCFSVQDNGIGIEPQYAERIFAVFQRLHSRQKYEGTGIGLAICKRIVERHGGRIWVESEPEKGSTFFFTLPDAVPVPPQDKKGYDNERSH